MLHPPTLLMALWACSIAYFDARYRRIPNVLSLGAWVLAASVLFWRQSSLMGAPWTSALLAAGFGMLVTVPAYLARKLGAGDVKFMVGIGLLTSLDTTLTCFVLAATSGGLMALLWLNLPRLNAHLPSRWASPTSSVGRWLAVPLKERRMAYGTLLAFGLLLAMWMPK